MYKKNKKSERLNPEVSLETLKELNAQLKSATSAEAKFVLAELQSVDSQTLVQGLHMYWHYLMGKYYYQLFNEKQVLEIIELACDHFQAVFEVATEHGCRVKNPKYWFKYAESLFVYSKNLDEDDAMEMLELSQSLTEEALKKYPSNSSLLWLKEQFGFNQQVA